MRAARDQIYHQPYCPLVIPSLCYKLYSSAWMISAPGPGIRWCKHSVHLPLTVSKTKSGADVGPTRKINAIRCWLLLPSRFSPFLTAVHQNWANSCTNVLQDVYRWTDTCRLNLLCGYSFACAFKHSIGSFGYNSSHMFQHFFSQRKAVIKLIHSHWISSEISIYSMLFIYSIHW